MIGKYQMNEPINAYIIDQRGRKVVDFKNNNLHLLNYSQPL